jgi:hypothetical protein
VTLIHEQEVTVPDATDQEARVRSLPDHRRAGRQCATPGCTTRIYIPGIDRCNPCKRGVDTTSVNVSSYQRDDGRFDHAPQLASHA